uniref:GpcrRhopsn4 domain-containing protein n=1 Tax=Trichuris muris TaxID=70415 RepID=A0A5S6QMT6_TRIMR
MIIFTELSYSYGFRQTALTRFKCTLRIALFAQSESKSGRSCIGESIPTLESPSFRLPFASLLRNGESPLRICAPMVRYSKLPFRSLVRHYGCQLCYTPMIYAKCFVQSEMARLADFSTDKGDSPLIVQFAADNADDFVKAAELVSRQCDGVDLNCGCPKRKTLDAACGSALLSRSDHLAEMIAESRRRLLNPSFSISAKVRIFDDIRRTVDLCQKLERAGLSFLTVHGRTPQQNHEPVDVGVFKLLRDSLRIPVVANGDAKSLSDVISYGQQTGVQGVMVARALLQNPSLFSGKNVTPMNCIQRWVQISSKYEIPFLLFHRHLTFMTEKLLTKGERIKLNLCYQTVICLNVVGEWESGSEKELMRVVAVFAFQKTDPVSMEGSRGYIYGNVTSSSKQTIAAHLVLVDYELFRKLSVVFDNSNKEKNLCSSLMGPVSHLAFEKRCFPNNRQDFFRAVPCPTSELCPEEDDPLNVVSGSQFSFHIQDTTGARFWYLLFTNCLLNEHCNWTKSNARVSLNYDVWLVNGHPDRSGINPFEHQFSFDRQDTMELFGSAFVLFLALAIAQLHSCRKDAQVPSFVLLILLTMRMTGFSLHSFYCLKFAFHGRASKLLTLFADLFASIADMGLMLLLIAVVKSWPFSIHNFLSKRRYGTLGIVCTVLQVVFTCTAAGATFQYIPLHMLETWSGWMSMALRLLMVQCFMVELRFAIKRETSCERADFLLHFGSGCMVWFVYVIILGVAALEIPMLWRYKIITGICILADFIAYSALVHIFWTRNGKRRIYFEEPSTRQSGGEEWDEFEQSFISTDQR